MIADTLASDGSAARVRQLVRRETRIVGVRRALECGVLAAAASLTCVAASILEGASLRGLEVWIAAAIVALLAGAAWWIEHRTSSRSVARALDRDGACLTALECELRGAPDALSRMLSQRVANALAASAAPRSRVVPSAQLLAAPCAAAALLFLALDAPRSRASARQRALEALAAEARALTTIDETDLAPSALRPIEALGARTAALAARELPARAIATELARLASDAQRASDALSADGPLARRLDEFRRHADELAAAGAGGARGAGGQAESAPPIEGTASSEFGRSPAPAAAGSSGIVVDTASSPRDRGSESGTSVAAGRDDGTMLRLENDDRSGRAVAHVRGSLDSTAAERPVSAQRWWPSRFDAVVESWVERERTRP